MKEYYYKFKVLEQTKRVKKNKGEITSSAGNGQREWSRGFFLN